MGFKITKDNIHTEPEEKPFTLVGKEYGKYRGGKHKFRLLDDDMNVYLYGVSDSDSSFAPLDRFEGVYGCVHIEYRDIQTKKYKPL